MDRKDSAEKALGFRAIYDACKLLYPDQSSPLQVASICKFKDGGPDPLDYIMMYYNRGKTEFVNEKKTVAPSSTHWHYVTAGLSNLYGDTMHSPAYPLKMKRFSNANAELNKIIIIVISAIFMDNFDPEAPSGYGFELTFRLKREPEEQNPPTWPAPLLQVLARYVFRSQSQLFAGDHIPWTGPLDKQAPTVDQHCKKGKKSLSKICHMVLVPDKQLKKISTPYGYVNFLQIVGITNKELQLVQRCTTERVTDLLSMHEISGGGLLVTNMRRRNHVLRLASPELRQEFEEAMRVYGSNLSGVTTDYFSWAAISTQQLMQLCPAEYEASVMRQNMRDSLSRKNNSYENLVLLSNNNESSSSSLSDSPLPLLNKNCSSYQEDHINESPDEYVDVVGEIDQEASSRMDYLSNVNSNDPQKLSSERSSSTVTPASRTTIRSGVDSNSSTPCTPLAHLSLSPHSLDNLPTQVIDPCLDIKLSYEAAKILPICIKDRLRHGSHFTFLHSQNPELAITFVSQNTIGAFVNDDTPYACKGPWLQVYLSDDFLEQLEFQFSCMQFDSIKEQACLPLVFRWPERKLRICLIESPLVPKSSAMDVKVDSLDLVKKGLFSGNSTQMPKMPCEIPPPELMQVILKNMHDQLQNNEDQIPTSDENLNRVDSSVLSLFKQFMYLK